MCGVIGAVGINNLVSSLREGLSELYRRGHEGTGITFWTGNEYFKRKRKGLPKEIIRKDEIKTLEDKIKKGTVKTGLGHVRYRTAGGKSQSRQPVFEDDFAIVHNGNIYDRKRLKAILHQRGIEVSLRQYSDTQLLAKIISSSSKDTLEQKLIETIDMISPTMNIIVQQKEKLYAYVDPTGAHPLSYSQIGEGWGVGSEKPALKSMGAKKIKRFKPGTLMNFEKGKIRKKKLYEPWPHHCIFEKIYVSSPKKESSDYRPAIWGDDLTSNREKAGKLLRKQFGNIEKDAVISELPNSGYYSAKGFSDDSRINLSPAVTTKTKKRTFITPGEERSVLIGKKYVYRKKEMEGKSVYLIEDSLVRGTTLWDVVKNVRLSGAKDLNIGIASAHIESPCFYGMNFPTYKELIAAKLTETQIETYFRARFLGYDGSKNELIDNIRKRNSLKEILDYSPNYLKKKKNTNKTRNPKDFSSKRFNLKYLTKENMMDAYADKITEEEKQFLKNESSYCTSCFTNKHWKKDWERKRPELINPNRRWRYERIAA